MKNTLTVFIALILPFSILSAQEKKIEKKIKIITTNESGNHVVIDTVFTDNGPDSLKLKDGSVVYLKHGNESDMMHGNHKYVVSSSANGNHQGKQTRKITIVQTDSSDSPVKHNVDFMIVSDDGAGNVHYKVTKKPDGDGKEQVYYYENKSTSHVQDDDTFNVFVKTDDYDGGIDKSRYVIAKDGIVVTVEGNDETKTQALAKDIEKKLGVSSESDKNSEKIKTEKTKTEKKTGK